MQQCLQTYWPCYSSDPRTDERKSTPVMVRTLCLCERTAVDFHLGLSSQLPHFLRKTKRRRPQDTISRRLFNTNVFYAYQRHTHAHTSTSRNDSLVRLATSVKACVPCTFVKEDFGLHINRYLSEISESRANMIRTR